MSLCIAVNTIFEIKFPSSSSIFTSHTEVLFPMWLGEAIAYTIPSVTLFIWFAVKFRPTTVFLLGSTVRYAAQLAVLSAKTHEARP